MKCSLLAVGITAALMAGAAQAETYVVQAGSLAFDAALVRQIEAAGGQVVARYAPVGIAIVRGEPSFEARAERIRGIQYVTPDMKLQFDIPDAVTVSFAEVQANPPTSGDDDFYFDLQWGHDAVDAPEAWMNGYRGSGARVAVLDSGIDCTHPDLTPNLNLALGASFVPGETVCQVPPSPAFNHGTHVAGTVAAADNAFGVIGVAPEAEIFAVKVLSAFSGTGSFEGVLGGMIYAVENDADVINMSLGVDGGLPVIPQTRELIQAFRRTVQYAHNNNTTVIASAGNDGIDYDNAGGFMAFPAGVQGVIAISATAPVGWGLDPATNLDVPTTYTNYGTSLVHLAGPGGDAAYPGDEPCTVAGVTQPCWLFDLVFSTSTGGWAWAGGTSMAAPHAAGVAAMLIARNGGEMHPRYVGLALDHGADDLGPRGHDAFYGRGRVNADQTTD